MTCQILAIMGSPIPDGNIAKLLKAAKEGAEECGCTVSVIDVTALRFSGCMEYFYCKQNEGCMIQDDITPIIKRVKNADGIILAAPVMTMGFPGMIKSFIDRMQPFFMAKYIRKEPMITKNQAKWRKTLLISIGGMNVDNDFDGIKLTTNAFCNIVDSKLYAEVLQNNMDSIEDVASKEGLLEETRKITAAMCRQIIADKEKYAESDA
ncbi:MAG: flavodoxin family protein [Methanomicrobium sp.]|nr:flavodoxin family protein [Methanomicrobium sp.]MBR6498044.1 flavodoxin family protein [Methanomicrobium sp.]